MLPPRILLLRMGLIQTPMDSLFLCCTEIEVSHAQAAGAAEWCFDVCDSSSHRLVNGKVPKAVYEVADHFRHQHESFLDRHGLMYQL